jgi:hypothetical protein
MRATAIAVNNDNAWEKADPLVNHNVFFASRARIDSRGVGWLVSGPLTSAAAAINAQTVFSSA